MATKAKNKKTSKVAPVVTIQRPSWNDVYQNYPKSNAVSDMHKHIVFDALFGQKFNKDDEFFTTIEKDKKTGKNITKKILLNNACATRISVALNLSQHNIKPVNGVTIDFIAEQGNFKSQKNPKITMLGKPIITTAEKMKKYLDTWKLNGDLSFSENELNADYIATKIGNRKGIYLMLAKDPRSESQGGWGATGHVTLWIGKEYGYVMGGESHLYLSAAKAAYFWELK